MSSRKNRLAERMAGFDADIETKLRADALGHKNPSVEVANDEQAMPVTGLGRALWHQQRLSDLQAENNELNRKLSENLTSQDIPLNLIDDSPFQIDLNYSQDYIQSLVDAWKAGSVPEPVLLRPKADGRFELVAGHHRTRAARLCGKAVIAAYVQPMDDAEASDRVWTTNSVKTRSDWEKALYFSRQLKTNRFSSIGELAVHFAVDKSLMAKILRMLELPEAVTDILRNRPNLFNAQTAADVISPALKANPTKSVVIVECIRKLLDGAPQSSLKSIIQQRLATRAADESDSKERVFGSIKSGFRRRFVGNRVTIVAGRGIDKELFTSELDALLVRLTSSKN